ncbi:polyprenyl synthetase family protein [Lentzea tibetensis]|uniref:Polyprenyl synthetase family protein n=1 Tax=Lentzea tibetensis TaxID=2591470 RepID=A0A563EL28_9PSEU|nr:polyprenyl synthetase family protein [Lentzea tibetensis]TWP46967.1 polyprenyl synthetase family protein [Lentzea tibetensis]
MLTPVELGLAAVDDELRRRVEKTILANGSCGQPWLDTGMRPLLTRPGKRLRPALVFAAAACGPRFSECDAIACAASVELMHLSSLVHDDLMDDAASRGGLATLHVTRGRDAAILGGDHLLAAGGQLAARVSAAAALAWHQGYSDLCAGQIHETANRYRLDTRMDEYLAAVSGKTGALMRTACRLGALCAGLSEVQVAALATFGDAFGMVFQLVDDLMDLVSTEQLWTKPVGLDLSNGVYTAAVLVSLANPASELSALLRPEMSAADVERAHECARRDGVPFVLELIDEYVALAERVLEVVPDSPARARLVAMPRVYALRAVETKVAREHSRWIRPASVA